MLRVEHLVKRYGDRVAVDDVSFTVERGQTVGLLGPNGAGKTTTISMITGLTAPDSGTVVASGGSYGAAISRAYEAAAKISFDGMHYRRDIAAKALI